MVNAYIPGRADVGPATAAMIARRDALLGPAYRLMYERPLHIVRGEGAWLIDPEGRRYLDAYNNVTSLGHCHPSVTEAICRQVQTLATNTRYLHDTILELAERLLASVPETGLAASDVDLHGQRGQRPRLSHREGPHRRHRRDRDRHRVSRYHPRRVRSFRLRWA